MYKAKERLHLARDGKTVVKPGDPRSASLLINEGGEMSDEEAKKYGLIGGPKSTQEDALPLDSTSKEAPPKLSIPPTQDASPFPQHIRFGGTKETTDQPPSPPVEISPVQPMDNLTAPRLEAPTLATEAPVLGDDQLPDEFPFKTILVDQDFSSKAKVKAATKEQLLGLKQIGSERADAIMAAAANL